MTEPNASAVSQRAIVQRINRRLANDQQTLRVTRPGSRWANDLGAFYIVDNDPLGRENLVAAHVDLETLARELGVLEPGETIAEQ